MQSFKEPATSEAFLHYLEPRIIKEDVLLLCRQHSQLLPQTSDMLETCFKNEKWKLKLTVVCDAAECRCTSSSPVPKQRLFFSCLWLFGISNVIKRQQTRCGLQVINVRHSNIAASTVRNTAKSCSIPTAATQRLSDPQQQSQLR